MANRNKIRLAGTTSNTFQIGSKGVILDGSTATAPYTLKLPAADGSDAQVLATDGSGNLTWASQPTAAQYTETIEATTDGQTAFVLSYTPTGEVAMSINGVTIPANAAPVSGATVNYADANNESYTIKTGDVVTVSYIYGTNSSVQQLNSLSDVNLNTPLEGQSLSYNATTGKWTNSNSSGTPAAIANGTSGARMEAANGNLELYVGGVGNVAVVSATGVAVKGVLSLDGSANLSILGGTPGQVLSTDGTGNLTWSSGSSSGSSGVSVPTAGGNVTIAAGGNTVVTATANGTQLSGKTTTINSTNTSIGGNSTTLSSNTTTISSNTTSITSNTTNIAGNTTTISSTDTVISSNTTTVGGDTTTINSNNTSITGNVDMSTSANISMGTVANLHIDGGTDGQFLQTDGAGTLTWATVSTDQIENGNSNVIVKANANVNISVKGTANVVQVAKTGAKVNGDVTITGDLTVSGTTTTVNQTSLEVANPIIGAGGLANGAALTTDDGKDRGLLQHYYAGAAKEAFMGWDNSNAEFAFGSDVSNTNNVITFTKMGNVRADSFLGANLEVSKITADGNVALSGANVSLGALANLHITGGSNGQMLTTDGAGNLTWVDGPSAGTSGVSVPTAGGNVEISSGGTTVVTATSNGAVMSGNTTTINSTNTSIGGNTTTLSSNTTTISSNVTTLSGNTTNITSGNTNVSGDTTTLSATTTNITSSTTEIAGDTTNITSSNTSISGNVDMSSSTNIKMGDAANVHIDGGTNGQVLSTDGAGHLSWINMSSGGGGGASLDTAVTLIGNDYHISPNDADRGFYFQQLTPYKGAKPIGYPSCEILYYDSINDLLVVDNPIGLGETVVGIVNSSGVTQTGLITTANVVTINDYTTNTHASIQTVQLAASASIGDLTQIPYNGGYRLQTTSVRKVTSSASAGATTLNVLGAEYAKISIGLEIKSNTSPSAFAAGTKVTGVVGSTITLSAGLASGLTGGVDYFYTWNPTAVAGVAQSDTKRFMGWSKADSAFAFTDNTSISDQVEFITSYADVKAETFIGNVNAVDVTTANVTTSGLTATGKTNLSGSNISLGNVSNIHITGGSNGQVLTAYANGSVHWADVGTDAIIANGNTKIEMYGNGGSLPNTISFFTRGSGKMSLTDSDLTVSPGSIIADEFKTKVVRNKANTYPYVMLGNTNITDDANIYFQTALNNTTLSLTTTGANIAGYANVTGNLVVAGKSDLGNVGNVKITGGSNTYQLTTDGQGNLTWVDPINASIANGGANLNFKDGGNMTLTLGSHANLLTADSNGLFTINPLDANGGFTVTNANATSTFSGKIKVDGNVTVGTVGKGLVLTGNNAGTGGSLANKTISIVAPSSTNMTANYTITLPPNAGTSGYFLKTDGSGNTSWSSAVSSGAGFAVTPDFTSPYGGFYFPNGLNIGVTTVNLYYSGSQADALVNSKPEQGTIWEMRVSTSDPSYGSGGFPSVTMMLKQWTTSTNITKDNQGYVVMQFSVSGFGGYANQGQSYWGSLTDNSVAVTQATTTIIAVGTTPLLALSDVDTGASLVTDGSVLAWSSNDSVWKPKSLAISASQQSYYKNASQYYQLIGSGSSAFLELAYGKTNDYAINVNKFYQTSKYGATNTFNGVWIQLSVASAASGGIPADAWVKVDIYKNTTVVYSQTHYGPRVSQSGWWNMPAIYWLDDTAADGSFYQVKISSSYTWLYISQDANTRVTITAAEYGS